jgi:psiF repeat
VLRPAIPIGILVLLLAGTPALAITAQEKMETCKFGADDQKLAGAARKAFLSKCMANEKAPAAKPKPAQ